jgi:hypothetical protein
MLAGGLGSAGFLLGVQAGEEEAGVVFVGLKRVLFLSPVTLQPEG